MEKLESKICRWLLAAAVAALATGCPHRLFATSPAEQALLAKAQTLAAHGQLNIAVQTWQQVLLSDPQNKEALAGIARAEMQLGNRRQAQIYLVRLQAAGGDAATLQQIESMSNVQPPAARLEEAQRLAQNGKYSEAMQIYRNLYGGEPPAGDAALAYYDTEAAIPAERQNAVDGLRSLAQRFPADSRYAITLGRVLTYDPKTRPEGIAILKQYPAVAAAQKALLQADTWNELAQTAAPETGNRVVAEGNPAMNAAYRALNSGHLDDARQRFQDLLAREPNNAAALSGMGYVLMKQQNFLAASDYLERARSAGARHLESAITLSNFWQRMAKGDTELKNGDSDAAIADYQAAMNMEPSRPEAMEALAGALLQKGNDAEAADLFKRVLQIAPDRPLSWRGLFLAQSGAGDAQAAMTTAGNMPAGIQAQIDSDPDGLRALAQDDLALGRTDDFDRVVKLALALPFPDQGRDMAPDQQMRYAALLMAVQRYEPAMQLYRQVIAANPENIGAWRALIGLEHQLHRDDQALATIGRIPQDVFSRLDDDSGFLVIIGSIYQSQGDWSRALEYLGRAASNSNSPAPAIELQIADVYAAMGEPQKAFALYRSETEDHPENPAAWRGLIGILHQAGQDREALRALASMPESTRLRLQSDAGYLQTFASIQVATGQNRDALRTFDQIAAVYAGQNLAVPVDVKIQYGWALLNAGEDRKLYTVISAVANSPEMTKQQQADFNRLLAEWSVRRANAASAAGNQRNAIVILETAARAVPGNTDVLNSLAGAYLKAGEAKRAELIYESLDMNGATLGQYEGAIGAALAAGDTKHAATWLETALQRFKNNAAILQMAGQYEQATGHSQRAIAYYRAALAAMGPETPAELFSSPGGTGGLQNQNSPTRDLMDLLAPAGRASQSANSADTAGNPWSAGLSGQNAPAQTVATLGDFAQSGASNQAGSIEAGNSNDLDADNESGDPRPDSGNASTLADTEQASASAGTTQSLGELKCCSQPDAGAINQAADDSQHSSVNSPAIETPAAPPADENSDAAILLLQSPANKQMAIAQDTAPGTIQLAEQNLPPLTGPAKSAPTKTPREQITQQLETLEGASSAWLGGTSSIGYRSGQPGYDRLSTYSTPVEGSTVLGTDARLTVITEPMLLDSGTANGSETLRQGTLPANSVPTQQSASGIGGELQLRTPQFAASFGYTPHGFLVGNVIAGLYIHPASSPLSFTFSRSPILDTQLSLAGLRDEGSAGPTYPGNVWGGVIANSGEIEVAKGSSQSGWYLQGGGQYITGVHVPTNSRYDGDFGAYWGVWQKPQYGSVNLGMNFFGMHYAQNLRYFTYGQGGYFSPDAYVVAGLPVTVTGHYQEKFHYHVSASLGIQAFNEESTPYFPLDPAIQTAQGNLSYPALTSVGGNYNFDAEGSYAIANHWYLGGFMAFNNSRDYASSNVGFYIRYLFRQQPLNEDSGPTGIFPASGLRPLQVP